jgi:heterotetrameric sarcosine oxidase delta subunit
MIRIDCPFCGPRDETEFVCGGTIPIIRPDPARADDAAWRAYLFDRENPAGPHRERWLHRHGCGQWFAVERCTISNHVQGSWKLADAPPVKR